MKFYGIFPILSSSALLLVFIEKLFYTGLPEEIIKYSAIKMSKPMNQIEILKNSMYVSTIFMFYENYSYAQDGILIGLWRAILPVHIISQVVMSYFLLKSYDVKEKNKMKYVIYSIFSIILPIIIHTTYNCYASMSENGLNKAIIIFVLGIIAYFITYKYIRSMAKKYSNDFEESVIKINKTKIITIILVTLFWVYTFMIA